jgi:hypothetical protein
MWSMSSEKTVTGITANKAVAKNWSAFHGDGTILRPNRLRPRSRARQSVRTSKTVRELAGRKNLAGKTRAAVGLLTEPGGTGSGG